MSATVCSRAAVIILIAVLTAGCTSRAQPDLAWMYAPNDTVRQPPLIIVPGLMGTRLFETRTGQEVWPGGSLGLLFGDYRKLSLGLSKDATVTVLEPGGLTDSVAGRDFYGSIIRTLEDAAGYQRAGRVPAPGNNVRQYHVFTYDWRQDLQRTAAELDRLIESIRSELGSPDLRVDIVAHSMGGLIARYFLRYGAEDVLNDNELQPSMAGAAKVRRTILLGTPNLGSVDAIRAMIQGRRLGFRTIAPETLASMPSMFQLFPHALVDWIVTTEGKPLERDQFDLRIWRRFRWSIFDPAVSDRLTHLYGGRLTPQLEAQIEQAFERRLERARRFVWSLTVPTPSTAPLIVFGGDCRYTPTRIVVEEVEGESHVRLWPDEIRDPHPSVDYQRLMLEPGDGVVTKSSLLARMNVDPTVPRHRYTHFPLDYAFLLCERHDRLAGNRSFQDNLLDALLRRATP